MLIWYELQYRMQFELPFIKKEKASEHDAYSFFFDRRGVAFDFRPGQYIRMTFEEVVDERGNGRFFTVSSSPTEKDIVMITTRIIKSPYKMYLSNLSTGEKVSFSGPFGNFTFDESDLRPRVFIAGGIGITPFRSMIVYTCDKKVSIPITLFASYSTASDIVFGKELDGIAKRCNTIKVVTTITKPEESKMEWKQEVGRLDKDKVRKYIQDLSSLYFIAGPEGLVSALSGVIKDMGVSKDFIKTENFPGY